MWLSESAGRMFWIQVRGRRGVSARVRLEKSLPTVKIADDGQAALRV
jgi:hypothetical protein